MATKLPNSPPVPAPGTAQPSYTYSFLSADEQAKHDRIKSHFSTPKAEEDAYTLDGKPLDEEERFWLSEECIQRYVRATKGSEPHAITRMEATLRWRREFGFGTSALSADELSIENETGKQILFGYDNARRPCLYLLPSRQNTDGIPRQIKFVVYMLERTIELLGPGVENLALLINFADKAQNPSLSTARQWLVIFQEHYPERLGAAYLVHIPFLVNLFLKAVMPFVDPKTRTKIHINPKMVADGLIKGDQLTTIANWGGDIDFDYEHAVYWPALNKLCSERKERELEVWRAMGSAIGTSEWEVKCKAHGGPSPDVEVPSEKENGLVPPIGAEKVPREDGNETSVVVEPVKA